MTYYKLGAKLAFASLFLMSMIACNGKGFPVALTSPGNANSNSGSGSGSNNATVTKGTGTTACGDEKSFQECANLPVDGATYTSPVPISAYASSQYGMSGWQAYVDGNLVTTSASSQPTFNGDTSWWNATIPGLSPGTHLIGINVWDNNAPSYSVHSYTATITVPATSLPTPPSTATTYTNLQEANGSQESWKICNGPCSGSSGTGSSNITLDATNFEPSLSGSTMEETSTGAAFNTLGYLKPPCPSTGCTSVTNFIDDVWFYIPSTTTALQALEFDPDVYDGNYEYFMSMQCDSATGDWRFWDMANGDWTTKQNNGSTAVYPCSLLTETNQWHHFQLYGTVDYSTHTYTYQTFVIDGVTVYKNLGNSYNAKPYSSSPALVVEQQIDNNSSAASNSVYYDNYSLTVW
jgi:hypothetical protein